MTEKVKQQHMFSNKMIAGILIPVVLEQLLNSIMGTADTMMVSNIGSAAISAVSLVDSINILVIQAFSALAAGGAIVCSQYIGQQNKKMANESQDRCYSSSRPSRSQSVCYVWDLRNRFCA